MRRWFPFLPLVSLLAVACAPGKTDGTSPDAGRPRGTVPADWRSVPAYAASAYLFDDTVVRRVDIRIDGKAFTNVVLGNYNDPSGDGAYAPASAVTIDGETLANVGLRSRGNMSKKSQKRQFKLSFDCKTAYTDRSPDAAVKFAGQGKRRFHGVRKINLRSSQNDPTMLREKTASYVFERAGCPVSRVGFARVYINGEYWGLYGLVEQIDESFLDARFGEHAGNLFKGGWPSLLRPGGEGAFELTTNKKGDGKAALGRFFTALDAADSIDKVAALLDPANVVAYLAAAMLVGHWDSYAFLGNNDYLYHAADARYRILPWDVDNTFGSGQGWGFDALNAPIFDVPNARNWTHLFGRVFADAAWTTRYKALLATLLKETFNEAHLGARIDAWKRTIEAAALADPRKHLGWRTGSDAETGNTIWRQSFTQTPDAWHGQGFRGFDGGLKGFIKERAAIVASQL